MEAKKKAKVRKQGAGGRGQAHRAMVSAMADRLAERRVIVYRNAQDIALAWFSKCKEGPNDFSGTKRQIDDLMLRHATLAEAMELIGEVVAP